jgi:hypothetical protein
MSQNSTCFGHLLCPSSAVSYSTFAIVYFHAGYNDCLQAESGWDNYCVWLVIKRKSVPKHGNMNIKPINRHLPCLNLETRDVGPSQVTLRLYTKKTATAMQWLRRFVTGLLSRRRGLDLCPFRVRLTARKLSLRQRNPSPPHASN